jgi:DNA-binding protein H-NS
MSNAKPVDLEALSISELEQLSVRIGQEIARKRAIGRAWLREHGTRVTEADPPIYQNPDNAAQTWSGKGKRPLWVEHALAKGRTLDSLRSEDLRPVPRAKPHGGGEGAR